ncbi:hypothetical protein PUN28_019876 [Cardiocondyla obscurior]|uniref:Uncharacterized protein n=1 Tax=Cardiocondyla obscurior TaxID=286306 RepID=A0AAW2EDP5_9HYME
MPPISNFVFKKKEEKKKGESRRDYTPRLADENDCLSEDERVLKVKQSSVKSRERPGVDWKAETFGLVCKIIFLKIPRVYRGRSR